MPDWLADKSDKVLIALIADAYKDDKIRVINAIRGINRPLSIYSSAIFLELVYFLDNTELSRFYNNISLTEDFIKYTLQNLYGVSQSGIYALRKRLFLFGLENEFRVDNTDFFNRLLFISGQLFKLEILELKSFLYHQVNTFETKSSKLLFLENEFFK